MLLSEIEPFETAIILGFVRRWPFVTSAAALLPAHETLFENLRLATMAQIYPEDRGTTRSAPAAPWRVPSSGSAGVGGGDAERQPGAFAARSRLLEPVS